MNAPTCLAEVRQVVATIAAKRLIRHEAVVVRVLGDPTMWISLSVREHIRRTRAEYDRLAGLGPPEGA